MSLLESISTRLYLTTNTASLKEGFLGFKNRHHFVGPLVPLFGLSYIERPILGDNPKGHNYDNEKCALFMKSTCAFCEKHLKMCISHEKQQKQLIQHKSFILTWSFIECRTYVFSKSI